MSPEIRRQPRSHSDVLTKKLAVTNKGRMPYQKNPKNNEYRITDSNIGIYGVGPELST